MSGLQTPPGKATLGELGEAISAEKADEPTLDDTTSDVRFGYGPTLNGVAVPLVDAELNEVFTHTPEETSEERAPFFLLGSWVFRALGCTKLSQKSFSTTRVGITILNAFNENLGPRTRTMWFVDDNRSPIASTGHCVCVDGVKLEILPPRNRKFAVKLTNGALAKFVDLARQEIRGTLRAERQIVPTGSIATIIGNAASTALSSADINELKSHGFSWHPSRLRFVQTKDKNVMHNVSISRAFKKRYATRHEKLANKVVGRIVQKKTAIVNGMPMYSDDEFSSDVADPSDYESEPCAPE